MSAIRRLWARILLAAGAASLVIGGILAVGQYLRDDLRQSERYQVSIGEIDCDPPPGQNREEFLAEVHYYGQMPERFSALEPGISDKLSAAFARHPRVKHVDKVTVSSPNHIRVELTFQK